MGFLPWFDLTAAATIGALQVHRLVEQARLRGFVASLEPCPDVTEFALKLASRISNGPSLPRDRPYITRLLEAFGSSPSVVIRLGGCCSGKSRLYMLCLDTLGIKSHHIVVYHRSGNAQHRLVGLQLPEGELIADPLYGIYYTDPSGRFLSLEELQSGAEVTNRLLPATTRKGYPDRPYYDFDYSNTKTANWTMSCPRRVAYAVLRHVMGRGVDRLHLPVILEWPQVQLSLFLLGAIAFLHGMFVLVRYFGAI